MAGKTQLVLWCLMTLFRLQELDEMKDHKWWTGKDLKGRRIFWILFRNYLEELRKPTIFK
jgi:hypothetical protein